MKKAAFLFSVLFTTIISFAQHCPWDCTGMIQLQTDISKETVYKMRPVLVDEKKMVVTDTIYGTGKDTYDRCDFLFYDDFVKYRKKKIAIHHWYQYDTMYHFAEGRYIVHYNFCKYRGKKLFLRYIDPYSKSKGYRYIEIPADKRIHLHDYNNQLRQNETAELKSATKQFVLEIDCEKWGVLKKDCR
jgi:hypothetical protein